MLYDITDEVYGMHLPANSRVELQRVFHEQFADQYGLYFTDQGESIAVSDADRFDAEFELGSDPVDQLAALQGMRAQIAEEMHEGTDGDLIDTGSGSGEKLLNEEIGGRYLEICDRYLDRLTTASGNPNWQVIRDRLDQYQDRLSSSDQPTDAWFQLPAYDIETAMMLGMPTIGEYLFRQTPG
jgi:hypothetical protein